jgi:hypothetical protein
VGYRSRCWMWGGRRKDDAGEARRLPVDDKKSGHFGVGPRWRCTSPRPKGGVVRTFDAPAWMLVSSISVSRSRLCEIVGIVNKILQTLTAGGTGCISDDDAANAMGDNSTSVYGGVTGKWRTRRL